MAGPEIHDANPGYFGNFKRTTFEFGPIRVESVGDVGGLLIPFSVNVFTVDFVYLILIKISNIIP